MLANYMWVVLVSIGLGIIFLESYKKYIVGNDNVQKVGRLVIQLNFVVFIYTILLLTFIIGDTAKLEERIVRLEAQAGQTQAGEHVR